MMNRGRVFIPAGGVRDSGLGIRRGRSGFGGLSCERRIPKPACVVTVLELNIFRFINIVGCRAITIFVLIEIVGPSPKHVFLSFIFNDIVGPSFIFAPPFFSDLLPDGKTSSRSFQRLDSQLDFSIRPTRRSASRTSKRFTPPILGPQVNSKVSPPSRD